jgi:hypothetical protein
LSERPPGTLVGTLQLFADITRFRKGPEDVPASTALLGYCILIGVGIRALAVFALSVPSGGNPLVMPVIDTVATLLYFALVLNLARHPERFLQTVTAIFGYQLVMLPLAVLSSWMLTTFIDDPVWKLPAIMLSIAVEIWGLAVIGRILNSATGWPMFACMLLAIAGDLLSFLAMTSVFPPVAATATPA